MATRPRHAAHANIDTPISPRHVGIHYVAQYLRHIDTPLLRVIASHRHQIVTGRRYHDIIFTRQRSVTLLFI